MRAAAVKVVLTLNRLSCVAALLLLLPVAPALAAQASGGPYAIVQSVIASGGTTSSNASGPNLFSVTGTVGQAVAGGPAANPPFHITSGFWPAELPAPEISIEQPVGVSLVSGLSSVDFGTVNPGGENSHTFTIRNTGTAPLTGLGITFAGHSDFSVTSSPSAPVAPGGSTLFTVRFAPATAGQRAGSVRIASNDADEPSFEVGLTGARYTHREAWRVLHFGSSADSGAGAGTNDAEGDGLSNDLEFATGSHPKLSSPMPGEFTLNANMMEFVYTRSKEAIADGFSFQVRWIDNLAAGTWQNSVTDVLTADTAELEHRKATAPVPAPSAGGERGFMRLTVTPPP